MKHLFAAVLAMCLGVLGRPVYAGSVIVEEDGKWQTLVSGHRAVLIKTQQRQVTLFFTPTQQGFISTAILSGIEQPRISLQIGDFSTELVRKATNDDRSMYMGMIPAHKMPVFIHNFTRIPNARIVAGPYNARLSLNGTVPAISVLAALTKEHNIPMPPPFTPARAMDDEGRPVDVASRNLMRDSWPFLARAERPSFRTAISTVISQDE